MIKYVRKILIGQFEAALAMLHDCIDKCPPEHWDGKIANQTFWQVAYHTLCYVDLYLSPEEASFTLREFHNQDKNDPFRPPATPFTKGEIKTYLQVCRDKVMQMIGAESPETLERESGFYWLPFTHGELHIYNIRHVMHHTGQLSAYLRRTGAEPQWVASGWRVG